MVKKRKSKNKLVIHAMGSFTLEGKVDPKSNTRQGARENAEILYDVLMKGVSAMTFLEFMKKLQSKTGVFFNPSKRDHT